MESDNNTWYWPSAWVQPSMKNQHSENYVPKHIRDWLRGEIGKKVAKSNEKDSK